MGAKAMRSRSFSKPTREECEVINKELSTKDANTLRSYIKFAVEESPEIACLMMRLLSVRPESHWQPEKWSLKRPASQDDDCDMNGIENQSKSTDYGRIDMQSVQSSRKRKSLSDRDMNVPFCVHITKRHRVRDASWGMMALCANCGNVFGEQQGSLHGCIYHPGTLTVDRNSLIREDIHCDTYLKDTQGSRWTCCGADGGSAGCLTTRHANASTTSKSAYYWVKQRWQTSTRS